MEMVLKLGVGLQASKHIPASFLSLCTQQDVLALRKLRTMS